MCLDAPRVAVASRYTNASKLGTTDITIHGVFGEALIRKHLKLCPIDCFARRVINMAVVENWLPPSRENWEWICYVWQFFPVVSTLDAHSSTTLIMFTGYGDTMVNRLVPSRQDFN